MEQPFDIILKNPAAAIMLACIVVIFREVISGVKSLVGKTSSERNTASSESLVKLMTELATNLHLLNENMKHQAVIATMRHDQLVAEMTQLRQKVDR